MLIIFDVNLNNVTSSYSITNNGYAVGSYIGNRLGYESNIVATTIINPKVELMKAVDKNFAKVSEILTYTIVASNSGNVDATNVRLIDTIPVGATLVPNSLKQDGVNVTGIPNYLGVTLPNAIVKNGISTIVYQIVVTSIPEINPIINIGNIKYNYTMFPTIPNNEVDKSDSNSVQTQINNLNISKFTKYVDKVYSTRGDTITYTVVIENTGNIEGANLKFTDTISSGTTFINNSVKINGAIEVGVNPALGINIGSINPNEVKTIEFKVIVN